MLRRSMAPRTDSVEDHQDHVAHGSLSFRQIAPMGRPSCLTRWAPHGTVGLAADAAVDNAGENGALLLKERASRCCVEGTAKRTTRSSAFHPGLFMFEQRIMTAFTCVTRGRSWGKPLCKKAAQAARTRRITGGKTATSLWAILRIRLDKRGSQAHGRWISGGEYWDER